MSALRATMALDIKLQARSQLYTIGVMVALLMGIMVRFLIPEQHIGKGLAAFFVLGLGGTTFMFGASMLLLEKGERTLDALRVTGLRSRDYVLSKATTLTAFALLESGIVYAIAGRGVPTHFAILLLGATVLGLFYSFLGLAMAAPHSAITRFLLPWGTLVAMLLQLPFLSLVDVGPDWLWYCIPTQAPLLILQGAFEPLAPWQWAYASLTSLAMLGGSWWWCQRRFDTHIQLPRD